MPVSEIDLELLEEYLDGTLEGGAATALGRRLAGDAALSAALEEARAHRTVRQALWKTIDPDQVAGDRLSWRIRGAMLDQDRSKTHVAARSSWSSWSITRIGSAAAACIVLGFLIGRVGRSGSGAITGHSTALVSNGGADALTRNTTSDQFHPTGTVAPMMVPVTNEYGQVVAWQKFDDADQAKSFEEDLNRAHNQPTAPAISGEPKLASETHF